MPLLVAVPAWRPLFTLMYQFLWTIRWEPAHSSPLSARSLPFGWSCASSTGLVPPWTPLDEKMLWAGAFKSSLTCACPGHHVLRLSFQPLIYCERSAHAPSQHHPALAWGQGKSLPGKASFDTDEHPRVQVLNKCGNNHHGNTLSFLMNSVVFILRRSCGSEGGTDRKPGPDGLWHSYDALGKELRSWVWASSIKHYRKPLGILWAQCGSPNRQRKEISALYLCCNVCLKHEISLKQKYPAW